jgi:cell division protein FtsX
MRKFYLITTTSISIFLAIAGIVLILNINAHVAEYTDEQSHVALEDVNDFEKEP